MECNKISIVVPVFNVEQFLQTCVDSIVAQTFDDWELILVNDGSTDSSGVICDRYAQLDSRIRVYHIANGGVSRARNYGLNHANGEWICFIDSDDYVDRTYLETFINTRSSDLRMQGYIKELPGGDHVIHTFLDSSTSPIADLISESERQYIINSPCFKLYNLQIIRDNNILFDINTSYGEDHIFSLTYLLYVNSISVSTDAGYHYRWAGENSLTRKIIDPEQLSYYIIESRRLSLLVLQRFHDINLVITYNDRLIKNCKFFIRNLFRLNNPFELFRQAQMQFKMKLNNYESGLSIFDAAFMTILLRLPPSIAFFILKSYCKIKK